MKSNLAPDDKKQVGLYILHNPNTDEFYVGSGNLGKRKNTHAYFLRKGSHWNHKLQEAYNRDSAFEFIGLVVQEGSPEESRELALQMEQSDLDHFEASPLLLNIAKYVDKPMLGFKHTPEVIEQNRQNAIKLWSDPEWKQKTMSAVAIGKAAMSDEEQAARAANVSQGLKQAYAEGVRISNAGQVRSAEFCEQNSAKIKDKWQDPEYRSRQMTSRQGKTNEKARIPVIGDGVEYPSKTSAAETLGISKQSISYRLQSTTYPGWFEKPAG